MKYILYIRESTDEQKYGLGAQRTQLMDYLKNKDPNAEWVEFVDAGYSGGLDPVKRPALMAAVDSVEPGDVLLMGKRDRLSRSLKNIIVFTSEVEKRGGRLVTCEVDEDAMDEGTVRLIKGMLDVLAEYELFQIQQRTIRGLREAKRLGRVTGRVPYGYQGVEIPGQKTKRDKPARKLEKCELEQHVLFLARDMRSKGLSYREIAKELNDQRFFNRADSPWSHVSIFDLINRVDPQIAA